MSDHPESRVVLPAGDLQHFACKRKGRARFARQYA